MKPRTSADALLILTEWEEFANSRSEPNARANLRYPIVIDGRESL